jgi:methyl-accepting chemotaxis protein
VVEQVTTFNSQSTLNTPTETGLIVEAIQAKISPPWLALILFMTLSPVLFNLLGVDFGSVAYSNGNAQVSSHIELIEQARVIANLDGEDPATLGKFVDHMFFGLLGGTWHVIFEFMGIAIALLTFMMAFGHYMVERKLVVPFIGILVIMSAMMDTYHILAASRVLEASTSNAVVIPFTWAEARMFNAFAMSAGLTFLCLFNMREKMHVPFLLAVSVVLLPTAMIIIGITSNSTELPQSMFKDAFFARPYDVVPLIFYSICLFILAPYYYRKNPSVFAMAIILCLLAQVIAQLYMSFLSSRLFDNAFHVGHYLKGVSYVILCIGVFLDFVAMARQSRTLSDNIGGLYKNMQDKVQMSVTELLTLASLVADRSKTVFAGSQDLTSISNNQVEHMTSVAAAMEEMSTSVQHVSANAIEIAAQSETTSVLANDGSVVIGNIIRAINEISNSVELNATNVNELEQSSQQITQVIGVINEIAGQTNLLALNAAIEAARAGEQGRGFAVVADEVRQLASRTQTSTGEISQTIKFNQDKSKNAVNNMNQELILVKGGVEAAKTASESMNGIVSGINVINDTMQQIATANEQQSLVANDVARQISAVEGLTKDVNHRVGEISSAADELEQAAQQLNNMAQSLRQ